MSIADEEIYASELSKSDGSPREECPGPFVLFCPKERNCYPLLPMKIMLGSASPRRREILSYFEIPFVQAPSDFDEDTVEFKGDPISYASRLAVEKADVLAKKFPEQVIVTADTVVFFNGSIYNKPKDEEEARRFLKALSGQWHQVFTAVAVQQGKESHLGVEETKILFNSLSDDNINNYLHHFKFTDKAGGYAIQQGGCIAVARIEGCYYNVMGLPINTLRHLLLKMDIDLWHYLKRF